MKCPIPSTPLNAALLAAVALAGCNLQHRQTISYPKLVPAGAIETGFDCPRRDDAILKTDAVRWVMREEGARLVSPGMQLAVTALTAPDEGHRAVHRADLRLVSLASGLSKVTRTADHRDRGTGVTDLARGSRSVVEPIARCDSQSA